MNKRLECTVSYRTIEIKFDSSNFLKKKLVQLNKRGDMHPILFQIGSVTFYTHGVLAVIGIVLGSFVVYRLAKSNNLDTTFFFDNIVFTTLFGIIGARVAYFLIYPSSFESWTKVFYLWEGGLVSYGGFFLGIITFILLLRKQGQPVMKWLDVAAIGFFLGLLIGRIGDLFAGEFAGVPTNSRLLSILPNNNLIAIPFFEALLCLLIVITATLLYRRNYNNLTQRNLFLGSFFFYGLGRFIIDFGRYENDIILHLSLGQIVSLSVAIIALLLIILGARKKELI